MISPDFSSEVLRFESVESTNLKARELAVKGATEGTVVVAAVQTKGRGRGKRVWKSPLGGLYCSFLLNARDPRRPTDLSILAGAAMTQAVKSLLPKSNDVSVKWPNDCLIGWKKVGGILSETLSDALPLCVVGIGLNVNTPPSELTEFEKNTFGATSFVAENGGQGEFALDRVLQTLMAKMYSLYEMYHREGFDPIRFLWQKNCAFMGKKVELSEGGPHQEGTKLRDGSIVGTFEGIDKTGAIVITNPKGEHHFSSGEIICFWP